MKHLSDDQIQAYLDQQLSYGEITQVKSHLTKCARCRLEIAHYQILYHQLENSHGIELSPNFTNTVLAGIEGKTAGQVQDKLFALFLIFFGIIAVFTTSTYFVDFQSIWTDMRIETPQVGPQSFSTWVEQIKAFIPQSGFKFGTIILGGLVLISLAAFDRFVLQIRFKVAAK